MSSAKGTSGTETKPSSASASPSGKGERKTSITKGIPIKEMARAKEYISKAKSVMAEGGILSIMFVVVTVSVLLTFEVFPAASFA